jgi:hypothetical protein
LTNFTIEGMSELAVVTITISVLYLCLLIPAFLRITDAIMGEIRDEVMEATYMKSQFKLMFDSLQEGIIVVQNF